MGIGINTGECVVGNMGSTRRFDYSCLGDAVNLASRLEGASKNYGVSLLLGEETARQIGEQFQVVELDRITVKGRTGLSPVYTIIGRAGDDVLADHQAFLDARYSGGLKPEDPLFRSMSMRLPELAPYYEQMRLSS
jgi:adenylate cyclase